VAQPTQILAVDKQRLWRGSTGDAAFAARFYRAIAMFLSIRMRNTVQRFGYGNARWRPRKSSILRCSTPFTSPAPGSTA